MCAARALRQTLLQKAPQEYDRQLDRKLPVHYSKIEQINDFAYRSSDSMGDRSLSSGGYRATRLRQTGSPNRGGSRSTSPPKRAHSHPQSIGGTGPIRSARSVSPARGQQNTGPTSTSWTLSSRSSVVASTDPKLKKG